MCNADRTAGALATAMDEQERLALWRILQMAWQVEAATRGGSRHGGEDHQEDKEKGLGASEATGKGESLNDSSGNPSHQL